MLKNLNSLKSKGKLIIKGIGVGIANLIPGVSGGTIALILGIYEDLIAALRSINLRFLLPLSIGIIGALLAGAKVIPAVIENYPLVTQAFFCGLILASVREPFRHLEKRGRIEFLIGLAGFLLAFVVVGMTQSFSPTPSLVFIFICGFITTCAMILPGISGALILVLLGQYKTVLEALRDLEIPIIVPFALGCLAGVLIFARFLSFLLHRYHSQTMAFLIGLMLGSLRAVWPEKINPLIITIFLVGLGLVFLLGRFSRRETNRSNG